MDFFTIAAVVITLAAAFSYLNHRFIGLPTTIGVMLISLVMSLVLVAMHSVGWYIGFESEDLLGRIDFGEVVFRGMLSFLLFAGALHININDLKDQKWVIGSLATFGVIISTFLVGSATWLLLNMIGLALPYMYCLLFGALISPTDPIAVLGILKSAGAPKSLETKITGESLFNDGVGVTFTIPHVLEYLFGDFAGDSVVFNAFYHATECVGCDRTFCNIFIFLV